jgi:cell division protease FtsH
MKRMVSLMSLFSLFNYAFTFVSHRSIPFSTNTKLNLKPLDISKDFITRGMIGSEWTYNDFVDNLQKKNIDAATILSNQNTIVTVDKNYDDVVMIDNIHAIKSVPHLTDNIIELLTKNHINFDITDYQTTNMLDYIPFPIKFIAGYFIFITVINFIRFSILKQNPNMGQINMIETLMGSNSDEVKSEDIDVSFEDVAGCDEAKYELEEVVDFLKNPTKFTEAGAVVPSGVLLEGPPGTGKTLLARAVAGEAGCGFISASGSQFIEMFVGVGASRVRKLFDQAQKIKPCIIFIDEIDAVGRQRGAGLAGGNDEREQTLNQILTNMDGFNKEDGIIVLAATNRADILDNALTRPGRFDRKVQVGLPDYEGRKKIMGIHFKKKNIDESVDFDALSSLTSGFSGADIANLANEAAILSVRYKKDKLDKKCVLDAFEKVTIGLPKGSDSREEKVLQLVAYHEAGHTVMTLLFKEFFDVRKVTINANSNGAGGYTLFTPKERYSNYPTKKFMLANLITALGGRAAEVMLYSKGPYQEEVQNYENEFLFPEIKDLDITTGASNDLKQANSIARRYVSLFGLSENIGLYDSADSSMPFLGRDLASNNKISEYTKTQIDREVEKLVQFAFETAVKILDRNWKSFDEIGNLLLENKTIDKTELDKLPISYK